MPSNSKDKSQYVYHKILISDILLPLLVRASYYYTYVDVDVEVIR